MNQGVMAPNVRHMLALEEIGAVNVGNSVGFLPVKVSKGVIVEFEK